LSSSIFKNQEETGQKSTEQPQKKIQKKTVTYSYISTALKEKARGPIIDFGTFCSG